MDAATDTRIVECPNCGSASCYVDIPAGATIVRGDAAAASVPAICYDCDEDFRVRYALEC